MADFKISDLPEATALTGVELFLASQAAADVQGTMARLKGELDWIKPADWPAMPSPAANTIRMLVPVYDHDSNLAAVRVTLSTGTYSVDWGDGTTTSGQASNTTAEHTYTYSDVDLGSVTSRGFKVALVTITTSGGNILTWVTTITPTGVTSPIQFLEAQVHASAMTAPTFANSSGLCEHIHIAAHGTVTSISFDGCRSLAKITETGTLFANITSLQNVFRTCSALKRFAPAALGTVTTCGSGFQNASSMVECIFPTGSMASATTCGNMFSGTGKLATLTFPSGALAAVTDASGMFAGCGIQSYSFPSGAFASACTNMFNMFGVSTNVRLVEFVSALTAVTNISQMFTGCGALQRVSFASGGFAAVASATTNLFNGCLNLSRLTNFSCPLTFTLLNCKLSATALDEIYTALPTITSQTVTVTGNYGVSADTPSIATGKGWTVTG